MASVVFEQVSNTVRQESENVVEDLTPEQVMWNTEIEALRRKLCVYNEAYAIAKAALAYLKMTHIGLVQSPTVVVRYKTGAQSNSTVPGSQHHAVELRSLLA